MKFAYFLADCGTTKVYVFCRELSSRHAALHVQHVRDVVKCKNKQRGSCLGRFEEQPRRRQEGHRFNQWRPNKHAHTHIKQWNIVKINNKSSVLSKWCQMEHTLSPRLCRLAGVLRSQLLSAFILLNLQPYQSMLDYMQPRFTAFCFMPQKEKTVRAWKSQYRHKFRVIYSKTNARDAWLEIRKCLKLRQKHPSVCPEAESVRDLSSVQPHIRLVCIGLHLQPLHLHHASLLFHQP